jgi:hypothetical protein
MVIDTCSKTGYSRLTNVARAHANDRRSPAPGHHDNPEKRLVTQCRSLFWLELYWTFIPGEFMTAARSSNVDQSEGKD